MAMAVVFMVLVAGAFIGGVLCMCHAGEKEGICQYEKETERR